ncbi:MAG: ABC transporter ATP-binding protein [Betaproteobacteria bacterium]|nr:ABC transporter ATP-binding protein [Betaproteobacteria bacterium]
MRARCLPAGAADTVLQVAGLSVDYATSRGPVHAVRDISFAIRRGETFGVVGESGSGKSTLAFAVMGYLSENGRVTGGRIDYQGQDLLAMPRARQDELRGAKIAMVYQDPMSSLNPSLQVGIQVAEALLAHERISREAARARTLELFAAVNMPEPAAIALRYPHQLSGGQQQRVLIAMALACNPDLLIMDEPTTGLDVTTEAQILDLIAALKHRFSSAILYISHNLGVIARVSDRIGVMYAGQMIEQGSCALGVRPPVSSVHRRLARVPPQSRVRPQVALVAADPGHDSGPDPDAARLQLRAALPACPRALRQGSAAAGRSGAGSCEPLLFWQEQEQARLAAGNLPPVASQYEPAVPAGSTSLTLDPSPRGRGKSAAVSLLKVDALTKEYVDSNKLLGLFGSERIVHALDGVSLTLEANETLAVVGESGCGKTTLARCIVGLVEPTRGTIEFDGIPLGGTAGERDRELRRRLQMVFQNPDSTLNPRRSIGEALMRPLEMFRGLKGATARNAAGELLRAVRLDERYLDRLPNQLSGGEKQRVGIARAFATNPDLIVCDEPVSALDVSVQAAILNLLGELQARERTAYLFISHDMSVVRYLADRVAVVYLGRICEVGPVERVFAPPYHPYTEALLSAVPVPDPDAEVNPIRLEGPVPSAANPPSGCVFHTRCPRKIGAICEQQTPPAQTGTDGHVIVCHIPLAQLSK